MFPTAIPIECASAADAVIAISGRFVAIASRMTPPIARLRRMQAPVQTFSQRGAPGQDVLTGKFEIDLGSSHLPPDVFAHLLHLAKTAVNLCGACSNALEAEEPVLGNRGEGRCG
jgi:hypothetical protein